MTQSALPLARRSSRRNASRWLRDQLRSEAIGGSFSGGLLPSEAQLMLAYGVPRAVVREALDLLRAEGLIERIQGTGTLAVSHRHAVRMVEAHGFGALRAAELTGTTNRVIALEVVAMPRVVANHLDAEPGEDCLLYEYIGYLFGQTMGVYTNYVRFPEAEALMSLPFHADWYTLLRNAGLEIYEDELAVELLRADEHAAELLDMPVGGPLFGMRQVICGAQGRPFDFAILRSRGDRTSLVTRGISPHLRIQKETRS